MMGIDRDIPGSSEGHEALLPTDLRRIAYLFEGIDVSRCGHRPAEASEEAKRLLQEKVLDTPIYDLDKVRTEGIKSVFMLSPHHLWMNVWRLYPRTKREVPVLDENIPEFRRVLSAGRGWQIFSIKTNEISGSTVFFDDVGNLFLRKGGDKGQLFPVASLQEIAGFFESKSPILLENWQPEYLKGQPFF